MRSWLPRAILRHRSATSGVRRTLPLRHSGDGGLVSRSSGLLPHHSLFLVVAAAADRGAAGGGDRRRQASLRGLASQCGGSAAPHFDTVAVTLVLAHVRTAAVGGGSVERLLDRPDRRRHEPLGRALEREHEHRRGLRHPRQHRGVSRPRPSGDGRCRRSSSGAPCSSRRR